MTWIMSLDFAQTYLTLFYINNFFKILFVQFWKLFQYFFDYSLSIIIYVFEINLNLIKWWNKYSCFKIYLSINYLMLGNSMINFIVSMCNKVNWWKACLYYFWFDNWQIYQITHYCFPLTWIFIFKPQKVCFKYRT